MRKGLLLGFVLVIVLAVSGIGFAATSHQVSVTVPSFIALSVGPDVSLTAVFDANGQASPSGSSTVSVRTNSGVQYDITATASASSTPALPSSKLFVNNKSLGSAAIAFTHSGKTTTAWQSYPVTYKVDLDGTEDPGTYSWTVNYTAAVHQ